MRSKTGQAMSALILGAIAPGIADAARKGEHRAENQKPKTDDAGNNRDTSEERNQSDSVSDKRNDAQASAQSGDTGEKSDNSGKLPGNQRSSGNDGSRDQRETDSGKTRGNSGHNADSDSKNDSTEDNDSHQHGGWRALGFAQKASDSTGDSPADSSPADSSSPNTISDATTVTAANPNVAIDDLPDTSLTDLVVQGNDHVLASVSTSGGFAFARSGDVIAVSGPDGASIVQSGDVNTGTSGTNPATPSDGGGNNDVGFAS